MGLTMYCMNEASLEVGKTFISLCNVSNIP